MKYNILLTIAIAFVSIGYSYGQQDVECLLIDSESQEAVIYANVGVVNTSSGTVSNDEGWFNLSGLGPADEIRISALGYETQTLNLRELQNSEKIMLKPIIYEFDELVISSKTFDRQVQLGERNEDGRGHSFAFGSAQLGTELGVAIRIDQETKIESVNFVLNHAKGDSLLFRINIYDYSTGTIGDKVQKKNIYLKDKQRKGTFSVDVSSYNIMLSDDVVLSIEWLRNFDELGNKSITFDTKKTKSLKGTFIKYSSQAEFYKMDYKKAFKPCIYMIGKQSDD